MSGGHESEPISFDVEWDGPLTSILGVLCFAWVTSILTANPGHYKRGGGGGGGAHADHH